MASYTTSGSSSVQLAPFSSVLADQRSPTPRNRSALSNASQIRHADGYFVMLCDNDTRPSYVLIIHASARYLVVRLYFPFRESIVVVVVVVAAAVADAAVAGDAAVRNAKERQYQHRQRRWCC